MFIVEISETTEKLTLKQFYVVVFFNHLFIFYSRLMAYLMTFETTIVHVHLQSSATAPPTRSVRPYFHIKHIFYVLCDESFVCWNVHSFYFCLADDCE